MRHRAPIKAEEHPNQTGSPEPWVPRCESAGRVPHQPFCAPEHGSDCCPWKLHKLQQVLALCTESAFGAAFQRQQ